MIDITIDGWTVSFVPRFELLGAACSAIGFNCQEDEELAEVPYVRRILLRLFQRLAPGSSDPSGYYALHWSGVDKLADLAGLDALVASGRVDDSKFFHAIVTEPTTVVCRVCNSRMRGLTLAGDLPIFKDDMPRRIREHEFIRNCPICDSPLVGLVAQWLRSGAVRDVS